MAVDLGLLFALLLERRLLLVLVELGGHNVVVVRLPELLGGLGSQNFLVGHHFLVVKLQVLV